MCQGMVEQGEGKEGQIFSMDSIRVNLLLELTLELTTSLVVDSKSQNAFTISDPTHLFPITTKGGQWK
jgi:hypothetical protein